MNQILNYLHTLRYLKFQQVYRRGLFRLFKPSFDKSSAPNLRRAPESFVIPARRRVSVVGLGKFYFLNLRGDLSHLGWNPDGNNDQVSKLWRYNQHYFDDLNAHEADKRRDWHNNLLISWLYENQDPKSIAWDPYPTSLRIVNWIKYSYSGNNLPEDCIHSWLFRLAGWLDAWSGIFLVITFFKWKSPDIFRLFL